ncbi:hypothetical protein B0A78_13930 [Flavobacterium columnare NBRC 100251 = ATCC 23463]|nr:hypothetical protein B0A78_13930 [Flavobacterium columnare NBRC 100251 = ATCC 23463]
MKYYPFGSLVPNRHSSSNQYRYGFNGKELDNELKGEGNSYDFGERLLDPRIGRWWSTDNVEKPWLSTYQFASNNPINNVDPDGNDEIHFYYKTQQMLDREGKAYTQLSLSSEIIKNNAEHTFFMHSPTGDVSEFHPFKSDRTPGTTTEAYKAGLPLSKGISFLGFFEMGVDDNAYLGTLLQAAPEVMEHYSNIREDGMRFKNAVDNSNSVDFYEKVIKGVETAYAIVDGYYLVKGLSKFVVKNLAKNSKGVDLILKNKPNWTPEQKAAASAKAKALTEAETVVVKNPKRASNLRNRYKKAGGEVKPTEDVDHIVDLQLGGADDILTNTKPLDKSVNRSMGKQINNAIKKLPAGTKINKVIIKD